MSAALPKRGTHIRELFGKSNSGSAMAGGLGAFEPDKHESQRSYDMGGAGGGGGVGGGGGGAGGGGGGKKKKGRAPAPPPVSALSHYKPKILSVDNVVDIPINDPLPSSPARPPRRSKDGGDHFNNNSSYNANGPDANGVAAAVGGKPRPFIMGDKDTPIVVIPGDFPRDLDLSVGDLTLTHDSAPLTSNSVAMPGRGREEDNYGTENPLFRLHEDGDDDEEDAEHRGRVNDDDSAVVGGGGGGGDADAGGRGGSRSNGEAARRLRARSHSSDASDASLENGVMNFDDDDRDNDSSEPNGVYIPAPDYDEEEKTMIFPDELDDDLLGPANSSGSPRRGQKVYKEYHGEDFAQYLSDEDAGAAPEHLARERPKRAHAHGSHHNNSHHQHHHHADRKSKTEAQRPHYKKREALPSRGKKGKSMTGSNSLRDFSFADSKYGTLGSSTKRHSMPSLMEDKGEAELFVNTGSSYEQFLRMKNGEDLGNVLTDTEPSHYLGGAEHPMVPPRYARSSHNTKDTLWKKLTWKFKKQT